MRFDFESTGIGSVPFSESKIACQSVFDNFRKIPFWPQLPKRSFFENMYAQFSERLPGVVIDEENRRIHVNTLRAEGELEEVYSDYLEGKAEFFGISEDYAEGFYEFLDSASAYTKGIKAIKGHITGPVSFGLSVTDENKRPIMYNKELFEALTKILSMKAVWQIRKLRALAPDVIIFVDEPYLVSIGSSYVNIDVDGAMAKLDEVIGAIKKEGALSGIHCCGNTDWSLVFKRDIDILNFDAYNFTKEFLLYTQDIKNFVNDGKTIAWGVIPSSEESLNETADSLASRLKGALKILADKGVETQKISSLVTPSCGLGTLDEGLVGKIFGLVKGLSAGLRG